MVKAALAKFDPAPVDSKIADKPEISQTIKKTEFEI